MCISIIKTAPFSDRNTLDTTPTKDSRLNLNLTLGSPPLNILLPKTVPKPFNPPPPIPPPLPIFQLIHPPWPKILTMHKTSPPYLTNSI